MTTNRESGPSRDTLSVRTSAVLVMVSLAILVALALSADTASDGYRTYQGGLLTFVLLALGLVPVRLRIWSIRKAAASVKRHSNRPYLRSDLPFFDLLLVEVIVVAVFILDFAVLRKGGARIGVAAALGLTAAVIAGLRTFRRQGLK